MKRGYTVMEMVVVLALLSLLVGIAFPLLRENTCQAALEASVRELYMTMQKCRMEAITRNRFIAMKFLWDHKILRYAIYIDGNGNGIRSQDIRSGVDRLLYPYQPLHFSGGKIFPGLLRDDIPDITTGKPIDKPEDPIKFGVSDILSFSPLGNSSPGTLYLTDGMKFQGAIRLRGPLVHVRAYRFIPGKGWIRL